MTHSQSQVKIDFGTLAKPGEKEKETQSYQSEIKSMMYACGDVRTPEKESSLYIEQIVYAQMKRLLEKSTEVSRLRESKHTTIEDVVFVLRKHPCRVKKLSNYIIFKDVRNKVKREVVSLSTRTDNRLKYGWLLANTYENVDELKERLLTIDRMTERMTKEEYLDFTECRQASFTFRKMKKFKEFLNTDYKIKDDIVDILGFVACEIVFDIVSLAGEISSKKLKKTDEQPNVQGMFRIKPRKVPISIPDIDEACRRLKVLGILC
ncbi:transcription initiation protein SPT3 [Nematocida displodere]|uniref:Transcription initiation protein SPT3 n=1 Tax=Nematocida displodere TaxID=1805483 RepID=A0A177EJE0_9MICR|nr:transcription initiation protein SPT3 [Nematocida displodere]